MKNNSKYDLIVVGGGFAGSCAAIAAAREGLSVLLVERYNCLGGAAGNGLVMPFMGYATKDMESGRRKFLCGDLFLEIIREMNVFRGRPADEYSGAFDEEILKLVLNRMCLGSGVKLLYDTTVISADVSDGNIKSIKAICKGVQFDLYADSFIDASGDAELSVLSGCNFTLGREEDGLCQPMTLCFRMSGVDKELFKEQKPAINSLYKEFKEKGLIKNPREDVLIFGNFNDGVLHFNTTRIVKKNPTDAFDLTDAEIEAREQVFEIYGFLKENFECFKNARVLSTALHIGIRESRKIEGEYTLTVEDLKSLARFDDAIAVANYDIDIHNPEGAGTSHYFFGPGEWYEIPYRCLLPKGMNNLLVAGRCISSTHEAQASYRIMPYCAELGQAAGVAAAVARQGGVNVRNVDIKAVREKLKENGFVL